jgi:ubiquinone/menaquinone biosynthesis C-methylase UbiE/uncharacterized protein YbaR (Trm112 family)
MIGGTKMNKYLQDYLISPETRYPLCLVDETEIGLNRGQLKGNDPLDVFNIVNGIPILLPHNHVADYNHNILDILYREKTREISNEIFSKTGSNYELYKDEFDKHILNEFGKEGILKVYEEYSKLPRSQKLCWFATLDKDQKSDNCIQIPSSTLISGLNYATSETGRKRLEMTDEMINKWACHLNDYGSFVTEKKSGTIVELATGAGLGTCGVINSGLGDSKLISIDIDYKAVSNADGIAKYLKIEGKVNPIVANFWYLPFKNNIIDTVCSHYGLDEAREIPSILAEISRILKVGGRFINVSRMDPTIRIKQTFGHLNFSENEYLKLASFAGFYSGMDDLINEAEKNNLILEYHKAYSPNRSHERILSILKKV